MGRGSNWLSGDDIQMCKSWLHVSEDPIVGTNQKQSTFWDKVMKHMQENGGDPARTVRAAQSRFALINAAVSKFVGVHAQQERSAPSGTNAIDIERRAFEAYRHETPGGKSFDFQECWNILRSNEKWASPVQPRPGQVEPIVATDQAPSPDAEQPQTPSTNQSLNSVRSRPIGVKRAKADLQQSKVSDRAVIAVEAANLLAKKRQRIMQHQVALGYFKLQDHDVPLEVRDVFLKTRAKLLNALNDDDVEAVPQPPPIHSPEDELGGANSATDDELPSPNQRVYASDIPHDHMHGNRGTIGDEECYVTHASSEHQVPYAATSPYVEEDACNPYVAGPSYVQLTDYDLTLGI